MDDPELWQEAQDRVLLYLKKLGMPAILSLEIAREALRKAADEAPAAGSVRPIVPTALAMRALHMIFRNNNKVLENTPFARHAVLYRRWHPDDLSSAASCSVADPVTGLQSAALPPIKRGAMIIRKI